MKEYAQLKKEMLRSRRAIKVLTGQQAEDVSDIHFYLLLTITQHRNDIAFNELLSPLEQRRQRLALQYFIVLLA